MKYNQPFGITDPNASYINGNPSIGLQGSTVPAEAIEEPQREICNAITAAGLSPSDADLLQLWKAMQLSPWVQEAATDTGTANNYAAAINSAPPNLTPFMSVRLKIAHDNTGASTFALNTFGTNTIHRADGSALQAGDLKAGMVATLVWDGGFWQIANYLGGGGGSGGSTFTLSIPYAVDSGVVNALAGTFSPTITSLAAGNPVLIKVSHVNTASVTLKCDALAPVPVVFADGSPITGGSFQIGMILLLVFDGSQFQLMSRISAGGGAAGGQSGNGNCYLSLVASNLVLGPRNGNTIVINNAMNVIPVAGIALAPTGLTPNQLYYIYAAMVGGTMVLEASTTGHSTSTVSGMEIKTGDETRTLVGMAYVVTGPSFIDADGTRLVASWFNRRQKRSRTQFTVEHMVTSGSFVEIGTEIRSSFVVWANELIEFDTAGVSSSSPGQIVVTGIAFDGTAPELELSGGGNGHYPDANGFAPVAVAGKKFGLTEGFHYATLLGNVISPVAGGWSKWNFAASNVSGWPVGVPQTTTLTLGMGA